MCVIMNKWLPH